MTEKHIRSCMNVRAWQGNKTIYDAFLETPHPISFHNSKGLMGNGGESVVTRLLRIRQVQRQQA